MVYAIILVSAVLCIECSSQFFFKYVAQILLPCSKHGYMLDTYFMCNFSLIRCDQFLPCKNLENLLPTQVLSYVMCVMSTPTWPYPCNTGIFLFVWDSFLATSDQISQVANLPNLIMTDLLTLICLKSESYQLAASGHFIISSHMHPRNPIQQHFTVGNKRRTLILFYYLQFRLLVDTVSSHPNMCCIFLFKEDRQCLWSASDKWRQPKVSSKLFLFTRILPHESFQLWLIFKFLSQTL